ncbi:MAG: MFS transporter [Proteobacteria bacterium]|nr:MFS transporter [Pseudomonadota bacterium]MBU1453647.1 MFS transporter [Pseudomonadota bacterium]
MPRRMVITLLLSVYIALLGIGIIVPVMPVFATDLGASGFGLGLIIAAFSISRGLLQPMVGSLSDRWGRKRFLVSGLFVYTLIGLILPQAASVGNLVLIRALHGVGSAMIVPVAMAYMGDMAEEGKEGQAMSMLNIAIFCGIGTGPLVGGIFTDLWGMESAFYAMAALSGVALILVLLQMPASAEQTGVVRKMTLLQVMTSLLAGRRTRGILLARMSTMIIMVPTMAFLPLLMHQWFDASGLQIGLVIACRTFVNALLQTPFGRLADRRDKVWLLKIGCLVVSGVMCLVPLAGNFVCLLILFAILGVGEAVIWPVLGALATEEGRRYGQGSMMGIFNLAMSMGVLLGALGAGVSVDFLGLGPSFVIIGIVVLGLTFWAASLISRDPVLIA